MESIAQINNLPVHPNVKDWRARANAMVKLVAAAKEATDQLVKAAEDIRKTSSPRADLMDEDSGVLVSNFKIG